jgi:hypothetical protein
MFNPFIRDGYIGQVPLSICPICFHKLDGIANMTGHEKPEPGDFTVCVGCRSVLKFGPGMGLELSSLMEVPTHIRASFAKLIRYMEAYPLPQKEPKP